MKVKVLFEIKSARGIIQPGEIIDISPAMLERLAGKVERIEVELWRWFVTEADKVFRSSTKSAGSWNIHLEHSRAAEALAEAGDIPAARAELEKALTALRGLPAEQQTLL
jgi:hypothetical protein